MKAQLIGESSAGMTAVEIYDDAGDLVWSHQWFDEGCSTQGYIDGLCAAFDCLSRCADVATFEGGETDDDGDPVLMDTSRTTGVMLERCTANGWSIGSRLGQGSEIIDACIIAGLVIADDEHDEDNDVAQAVAKHIIAEIASLNAV